MGQVADDFRQAELSPIEQALAQAAWKLTVQPWRWGAEDVQSLRQAGLDDQAIHEAVQVIGYFNYINRVCDGLGIDLEKDMPPEPANWKQRNRLRPDVQPRG